MRASHIIASSILALSLTLPAAAEDASNARGKAVFDLWCYSCHKRLSPGDMPVAGTSSLQRKYNGSEPAALQDRTDLSAAYIKVLVRHGTKSMPFSRKTEISDADLDALAEYLTKK